MSDIKSSKSATTRTRNYASVLYPESAKENWLDILNEFHIPCFISPLHNQDINPDGELKKAHYHILLCFDSVKTPEQAKEIFDAIGCVGRENVQSMRGYARYLCHLDNPEKFQYNVEDVKCLCGADYNDTIGLPTDRYKCLNEMRQWCIDNTCYSLSDLYNYAAENNYAWFRVLCDNGVYLMDKILKSMKWTKDFNDYQNKNFNYLADDETGEIING